MLTRSKTPAWLTRALNRSVCPQIQLTMKPPYEPPAAAELGPVQKRVFLQREIQALHQVVVDPAGPVLADLVGEILAVTGRAAGVDGDHGISHGREHLIIPAPVPFVMPGTLGAAMDQEDDRIGLLGVEPGRAQQPAMNLVVVGPGELEAFDRRQVELRR